jgi:hypothetical protein
MSALDDARKVMRDLLEDMTALKPYADPGNPDAAPFVAAFAAARARASEAAKAYADTAKLLE